MLSRDGFRGLTFEIIAKEAGENPALDPLSLRQQGRSPAALVDSVPLPGGGGLDRAADGRAGRRRAPRPLLDLHEGLPEKTDAYRNFFELIPHILRDEELQPHLRGLFEWYRKLDAWALKDAADTEPAAHIAPLALLTVAIADGIALQKLADPDLDFEPAFALWRRLVLGHVESGGEPSGEPTERRRRAAARARRGAAASAQPSSASAAAQILASSAAFAASSGSGM